MSYSKYTTEQLNDEFYRITFIPNARTNIAALTAMTDLMGEYEKRGIPLPNEKRSAQEQKKPNQTNKTIRNRPVAQPKKPWWKIW